VLSVLSSTTVKYASTNAWLIVFAEKEFLFFAKEFLFLLGVEKAIFFEEIYILSLKKNTIIRVKVHNTQSFDIQLTFSARKII
jgi:hypothetical protein